ncbi:MAG: tetratricopeptide repeat protein [Planctomycetota bacterium]
MPLLLSANEKGTAEPRFWVWLIPALLGALVFLQTLGGSAIYDDSMVFKNDDRLRDVAAWGRYWTEAYHDGPDNLYRPLGSMTFAAVWWLFGDAWLPQHAVNVALHGICAALTALLALRMLGNVHLATIAGIAFALHPIHVEPVAMLVGRFELLCTAATLAGLGLLVTDKTIGYGRALAVFACFVIAMLSKEQGLIFPLLAGVVAVTCRPIRRPGYGAALLIALIGIGLATMVVVREQVLDLKFWWDRNFLDPNVQPLILAEGGDRWLMPLELIGRYAWLLIWPNPLSIDYGGRVIGHEWSATSPYFWLGTGLLLAWFVGIAATVIKRRWVLLALLLLVALSYGPASNIASLIGTIFGERLLYMPSAFFAILLAMVVVKLPRKALVVPVVVALAWAGQTLRYADRWTEPYTYYQQAVIDQPLGMRLHMLLAQEHQARGKFDEARASATAGREADPASHLAWRWSAILALERGELEVAERFALEANRRFPNSGGGVLEAIHEKRSAE